MPTCLETVAAQAMQLSSDERADLADRLRLSVAQQDDIDAAWDAEMGRRIAQLDAGEVEGVPWETVIADLRAQLKRGA
ncbi:addiction module protein [Pseudorhodoferax sp. Leaf267]|uniref:addiction module protein n=1 Tax=Pseudorhodoferax sp. Leaf267 TaxID=1736316 RepID=UPI00138F995E|nr:addiction module protein [Pseudorhodoferax sp. Leaf267]